MRLGGLAAIALMTLAGCAASNEEADLGNRVALLRAEQQQRRLQLDGIEQQIQAARHELERQRCQATTSQLVSEISLARAECLRGRASFAQCAAEKESHTSKSGMVGCALGLAAGVFTGGAAAPLVAVGCGGGLLAGSATEQSCGMSPVCTPDENVLAQQVLQRHGVFAWPVCGP